MSETESDAQQLERWRTLAADISEYHKQFGNALADTPSEVLLAQCVVELLDRAVASQRTHDTALATVQALRDDALQERDAVTKELEEAKESASAAYECLGMVNETLTAITGKSHSDVPPMFLNDAVRNAIATARADALREVRKWVDAQEAYIYKPELLALLGGAA